jgi:hypothetical protein
MKRFSENGARPALALGGLKTQPFGRLGALVFRPHNSDTLYWASLRAATRIVGCALGFGPTATGWENVSSESRFLPVSLVTPGQLAQRRPQVRFAITSAAPTQRGSVFRFGPCLRSMTEGTPGSGRSQPPGADASAIHGRTGRSGCTAAEPYPPSRKNQDTVAIAPYPA